MIKIIQFSVLFLLFLLIIFLFFKIKQIPNSVNKKNHYLSQSMLKKYKYELYVKNSSWSFLSSLDKLQIGEFYNLIEFIDNSEKCYLGIFYLRKFDDSGIYFRSEKKIGESKLLKFSQVYNKTLQTKIFSSNSISTENLLLSDCTNWVKY
ncbi:hypothetical protein QEJ31_07790 [Pigmentibacter sp. JX0631]|uniref:hypothetical protein n=1 Tax=Pigmentibacter sp. JX0631 TaxID=2976982 RepID=UPI00246822EE|nr:hypothetical protein [Pigmentibacter sp. JX0631]WGL61490.1 hypothetical protein QEJ31_07790 [Pigmentibacter sp. JX0631]